MPAHCNLKQNMCLCSKQSSLFSFYALPSGGKSKDAVVHWNDLFYVRIEGWKLSMDWVTNTNVSLVTSCCSCKTAWWRPARCWLGEGPWGLLTPVKAINVGWGLKNNVRMHFGGCQTRISWSVDVIETKSKKDVKIPTLAIFNLLFN